MLCNFLIKLSAHYSQSTTLSFCVLSTHASVAEVSSCDRELKMYTLGTSWSNFANTIYNVLNMRLLVPKELPSGITV